MPLQTFTLEVPGGRCLRTPSSRAPVPDDRAPLHVRIEYDRHGAPCRVTFGVSPGAGTSVHWPLAITPDALAKVHRAVFASRVANPKGGR